MYVFTIIIQYIYYIGNGEINIAYNITIKVSVFLKLKSFKLYRTNYLLYFIYLNNGYFIKYKMNNLYLLYENITNGNKEYIINILSLASIFFAVYVIISPNPIVSVLFLIVLFGTIACYLIVLGMHFLGLSYLLVYVGAISILFIFILMLINIRTSELTTDNYNSIPLAIITSISFILAMWTVLPFNSYLLSVINITNNKIISMFTLNNTTDFISNYSTNTWLYFKTTHITSNIWDGVLAETSHISSIGNIMYTNLFIWLVVTSLVLLLAIVGAIIVTVKDRPYKD